MPRDKVGKFVDNNPYETLHRLFGDVRVLGNTQANEGKIWTAISQTHTMPLRVISPRSSMRGNFLFLQSVVINQKSRRLIYALIRSGHDTEAHDHRSACRNPRNDTTTFAEVD